MYLISLNHCKVSSSFTTQVQILLSAGEASFPRLRFFWAGRATIRHQMEKAEHKLGLCFFFEVPRELRHDCPLFFPYGLLQGRMRSLINVCSLTKLGFLNSKLPLHSKLTMIIGEGKDGQITDLSFYPFYSPNYVLIL